MTVATALRLVRFGVVGLVSALVDVSVLVLLHGVWGLWLPAAVALAYLAALAANFGLNRVWTFRSETPVGRSLARYLALVAANLLANVVLVSALASIGLDYRVAKGVVLVGLFFINYWAQQQWVFRSAGATQSSSHPLRRPS